jgi:HSP20 family molecular chaperone IbpA
MVEDRIKITPEVCSFVDEDHTKLSLEIALPGVPKENINIKMHEDSFALSASRSDIDYVTTFSFYCPVKPKDAKAKYEDGLLKVEVPFLDIMEDAVQIQVK